MKPNSSFIYNRQNLFIFGLLIAFTVTFLEVTRDRHANFLVFADAAFHFWKGISPYTDQFVAQHGRYFLYLPTFSVLFSPFAFLPAWLGPFVWNLINYTLLFASIFTLPERYTNQQKCKMFLFLLPILGQSLFSFQYNVPVAYLFLFAYTLLERGRGFWAVFLIMLSGCTKIYGIFELALLICYPNFKRNIAYALGIGVAFLALPLITQAPATFFSYYGEWFQNLTVHQTGEVYDSLVYASPVSEWLLPNFRMIQIGTLGLLALLFLCNFRKWSSPVFRAQALGILMGWVILLSESAEQHTYIIALSGFMLWYWSREKHTKIDQILLWGCFVMLCIVPIDLIVPVPVMHFITRTLWLHIWIFCITWIRMIWLTLLPVILHQIPARHKEE